MIEKQVDIETTAGRMDTFICHPERRGPWPGVIFYMDIVIPAIGFALLGLEARSMRAGGSFCQPRANRSQDF